MILQYRQKLLENLSDFNLVFQVKKLFLFTIDYI